MPLSAADLMDELENLSPSDLEREINEARERVARMELLLTILRGEVPGRKKRQPRSSLPASTDDDPATDRRRAATAAAPVIDRDISPERRVRGFLQVNGPTKYRDLLTWCGLNPAGLSTVLNGSTDFVQGPGNTWTVKQ